jgi:predicted nucleic acid-binding protein
MIVVDASVLSNAIGDDGRAGDAARGALRAAGDLCAPDLVDVETVAVLRKRWLAGSLPAERFGVAVTDLRRWDFDRIPARRLVGRMYELRSNVTAYDATYVALAEALDCELLTADRRLARAAGPRCAIRVLSAAS